MCFYFAVDALREMTGTDVVKGSRGLRTAKAAYAKLAKLGHKEPVDLLKTHLEEIAPGLAMPGDIGLLRTGVFGVYQGDYVYTITDQGVTLVATDAVERAFRVPLE